MATAVAIRGPKTFKSLYTERQLPAKRQLIVNMELLIVGVGAGSIAILHSFNMSPMARNNYKEVLAACVSDRAWPRRLHR